MTKAVIFDFDGTLFDTEKVHHVAWRKIIADNGLGDFTLELFLHYVGTSNETIATDYLKGSDSSKTVKELVLEKQAYYLEILGTVEPCPGAIELIRQLDGSGIPLAVASSSHRHEVVKLLKEYDVLSCFKEVVGGDMVTRKKPDPEIYLKTMGLLNCSAEECVAFEDTHYGVNAAAAAELFVFAVPNVFTLKHDFHNAGAIITSLQEAAPLLSQKGYHINPLSRG